MWFTGFLSAVAIKLTSSIDDVLWLAPFLTSNVTPQVRWQNALVYLGVCMIQTVVAMLIAGSGSEIVGWLTNNSKHAWSTNKILTVIAGVLLALYTAKLAYEHVYGEDEEHESSAVPANDSRAGSENKEESASISKESTAASEMELGLVATDEILLEKDGIHEGSDTSAPLVPPIPNWSQVEAAPVSPTGSQLTQEESMGLLTKQATDDHIELQRQHSDKKRQQTLFMIAFIGSIDDLTLFVPMLVGKGFDWLQLMCGAAIAGSAIVMICLFVGLCKPVADVLSNIPLAMIVATFSTVLLSKGFFMQ